MQRYRVKIYKKEFNTYGWGNWTRREAARKEAFDEFTKTFFRVLNGIVEAGGVVCAEKRDLDSERRLFLDTIYIMIPPEKASQIRSIPEVESVKEYPN